MIKINGKDIEDILHTCEYVVTREEMVEEDGQAYPIYHMFNTTTKKTEKIDGRYFTEIKNTHKTDAIMLYIINKYSKEE